MRSEPPGAAPRPRAAWLALALTCAGAPACVEPEWEGAVPTSPANFKSVFGFSDTDIWTAGTAGMMAHWDGESWREVSSGVKGDIVTLWGAAAADAWGVTIGAQVIRWNGTTWSETEPPAENFGRLNGLWGTTSSDVWTVSPSTISGDPNEQAAPEDKTVSVYHWNGTAWTRMFAQAAFGLSSVWGASTADAWAVGGNGGIVHWDGTRWTRTPPFTSKSFTAVHGSSSDNVWAVGLTGAVAHWDGRQWTMESPADQTWNGVHVRGRDDVWICGSGGTIMHRTADGWRRSVSGTTQILYGFWGPPGGRLWVVGTAGTLRRQRSP